MDSKCLLYEDDFSVVYPPLRKRLFKKETTPSPSPAYGNSTNGLLTPEDSAKKVDSFSVPSAVQHRITGIETPDGGQFLSENPVMRDKTDNKNTDNNGNERNSHRWSTIFNVLDSNYKMSESTVDTSHLLQEIVQANDEDEGANNSYDNDRLPLVEDRFARHEVTLCGVCDGEYAGTQNRLPPPGQNFSCPHLEWICSGCISKGYAKTSLARVASSRFWSCSECGPSAACRVYPKREITDTKRITTRHILIDVCVRQAVLSMVKYDVMRVLVPGISVSYCQRCDHERAQMLFTNTEIRRSPFLNEMKPAKSIIPKIFRSISAGKSKRDTESVANLPIVPSTPDTVSITGQSTASVTRSMSKNIRKGISRVGSSFRRSISSVSRDHHD